jgi:C-terminal processing protease CtpA/Prc
VWFIGVPLIIVPALVLLLGRYDDDVEQAFRVVNVIPDTPAGRSGQIQSGDHIISINGVPTAHLTYAKAVYKLAIASEVTLEVVRGRHGQTFELTTSESNEQHQCVVASNPQTYENM